MIKKFFILLFAAGVFLTGNLFCQEVYQNLETGFKMVFPEGWEITKGSSPMVQFVARYNESTSVNAVVKQSTAFEGLTIEQAADEKFKNTLVEQYSGQFENFSLLKSGMTDMNSYRAFYFKYSCSNPNGGTLIAKQYFIISSSKLYIISTGAGETDYPNFEPVFNEIVNSFTFL